MGLPVLLNSQAFNFNCSEAAYIFLMLCDTNTTSHIQSIQEMSSLSEKVKHSYVNSTVPQTLLSNIEFSVQSTQALQRHQLVCLAVGMRAF